jgi:Tfp pilus assembly protein PilZ
MAKGWHGGTQKRRSPRHNKRIKVTLEHEGKTYEARIINISKHGVLLPRRNPPSIGSHVKLNIKIMNDTFIFEGIVVRHGNCVTNGVMTTGIGIDIISPGYDDFVKDKITIA